MYRGLQSFWHGVSIRRAVAEGNPDTAGWTSDRSLPRSRPTRPRQTPSASRTAQIALYQSSMMDDPMASGRSLSNECTSYSNVDRGQRFRLTSKVEPFSLPNSFPVCLELPPASLNRPAEFHRDNKLISLPCSLCQFVSRTGRLLLRESRRGVHGGAPRISGLFVNASTVL